MYSMMLPYREQMSTNRGVENAGFREDKIVFGKHGNGL